MNINEIPQHLFYFKGTRITEFGDQYRFGSSEAQSINDGLNYILALFDITGKQTLITRETFYEFHKQVNPIELNDYVIPDPKFIDKMTDLSFRINNSYVVTRLYSPTKTSKTGLPYSGKLLYINFAKLAIEYYNIYGQWVRVEDLESLLRERGNDQDKMFRAINSKLSPLECASLKNQVKFHENVYNLTRLEDPLKIKNLEK